MSNVITLSDMFTAGYEEAEKAYFASIAHLEAELIEARKVIAAAIRVYSHHMCAGKDGLGCDACRDYERSAAHYRSLYPEATRD